MTDRLVLQILRLLVAGLVFAAVVGVSALLLSGRLAPALVVGTGLAAALILLAPLFLRESFDLFEPLALIGLTTAIGVTLRALYLPFSDDAFVESYMLLGKDLSVLLDGAVMILLGLIAFVVGYHVRTPPVDPRRWWVLRRRLWDDRRVKVVVALLAMAGAIGTYVYIQRLGIAQIALETLSQKRRVSLEGGASPYTRLGYFRWAAGLTAPAFYVLFAWFCLRRKRWPSPAGVMVGLVGLVALFLPIFTSSRSDLAGILLVAVMIRHYLRRDLGLATLVVGAAMIFSLVAFLGIVRTTRGDLSQISPLEASGRMVETLAVDRHFLDLSKTAHYVNAFPEQIEYQHGRSLTVLLLAPIPRTMWPGKPVIAAGEEYGRQIFSESGGVPPGIVGEMYLNFGPAGVALGMLALGIFLRTLYASFRLWGTSNPNAVLFYAVTVLHLGFMMPGGNFASGVARVIMDLLPLGVAIGLIGRVPGRDSAEPTAG